MEIQTITIIGAGALGLKFAYLSVRGGYRTILEDVSSSALDAALTAIRETLAASTAQIGASKEAINFAGKLATADSVEEAVREADLIVETAADELEMKLELFTIFDKFAKPGAILASTSNTIPIRDLAEITFCPEHCIGIRLAREIDRQGIARRDGAEQPSGYAGASEQRANHCEFSHRQMDEPNAPEQVSAHLRGLTRLQLVKSRSTSQQTLEQCIELARRMHLIVEVIHEDPTVAAAASCRNF
jgi:hypothetical protein